MVFDWQLIGVQVMAETAAVSGPILIVGFTGRLSVHASPGRTSSLALTTDTGTPRPPPTNASFRLPSGSALPKI